MNDKRIQFVYDFIDTVLSVFRVLLLTHFKTTTRIRKKHNQCIILGNGPSLIQSMEDCRNKWEEFDFVAVNHMAHSPQYLEYKPCVYVLCDPAFWFAPGYEEHYEKVERTYQAMLQDTDWPLQLYIPYQAKRRVADRLASNKNISVHFFNKTKFDGYKWLKYKIFNRQWGMVRAQNILNAALMLTIYSDYKTIYLAGADSDWLRRVWIDEQNEVIFQDVHFYSKTDKTSEVRNFGLKFCNFLLAQYFCFKSYVDIEQYARFKDVKVYNICMHSFIDAFEKKAI